MTTQTMILMMLTLMHIAEQIRQAEIDKGELIQEEEKN